jgi:copper chaperone
MATTNVTLKVEGMTCTGCEQRLGTALRRVEGVSEAKADHRTGELTIRYDPETTDREALEERVVTAGYEVAGSEGSA